MTQGGRGISRRLNDRDPATDQGMRQQSAARRSTLETRMVRIELTSQEAEELRSILDDYLSDLRMEIVDTEGHDFRVMLKKRKDLVKRFLDQLKGQA
jgi:acetolactate synthase small subunit